MQCNQTGGQLFMSIGFYNVPLLRKAFNELKNFFLEESRPSNFFYVIN